MLAIDHVVIVVADLDSAGRRFYREHGLASVAGGRHAGRQLVEHRRAPIGGDEERLASWLGHHQLPLRHIDGPPGPDRLVVAMSAGEPIIVG